MSTTTALTVADITAGYEHADYNGWGYLGARASYGYEYADSMGDELAAIDHADAIILANAEANGWDAETLFHWLNSKKGRWFGDLAFGGPASEVAPLARKWGLFAGTDFIPAA